MLDDRFSLLQEVETGCDGRIAPPLSSSPDVSPFRYDAVQARLMPVGGWNALVELKREYVEKVLEALDSQEDFL
ncbi:hypothetical protein CVT26_015451 [Gymnopilus dilepis]|uniref:Uncharacterized protein n=1 Tax=Gymnopilus dilepis TaxID=231916 RepID=A0A409W4A3_9AGAR|nr:hypothetical protein CVT26_015451 [Gymnopilus dilepis]